MERRAGVCGQAMAAGGPAGRVQVVCGTKSEFLDLQRTVGLPELRRHKRDFLRLATQNAFSRLGDPGTAQRLFVDYLRERVC
jgi:protein KTI12